VGEAQLGAFLIAIGSGAFAVELAGTLDITAPAARFAQSGVLLSPGKEALCFGVPYDGRSANAPLLPLLALMLAAAGQPVCAARRRIRCR